MSTTPGFSRRQLLHQAALLGATGLGLHLGAAEPADPRPAKPQFPAKAQAIIHLFAGGAPSHVDTFDPKPALARYRDKSLPGLSGVAFPSPFTFTPSGRSGLPVSSLFPQLATVADELCVIRSLTSDLPAHGPGARLMHTGSAVLTRPSLGSWVHYALGSRNPNLPAFITLGGAPDWRQAAFLPSQYQGSRADFASGRAPDRVLTNLANEFGTQAQQRQELDVLRELNELFQKRLPADEQLAARHESFELAHRLQTVAPEAFDLTREPPAVRKAYGEGEVAAKLLCARRLIERGVRVVQVEAGGWDNHSNLVAGITRCANAIDRPAAALIADLKSRGLLDSTLVIWGGEFGRTPSTAGRVNDESGRDHYARCFSAWMAGGGVKGGYVHGATDELGLEVTEQPMTVHDFHATILRLLGFDHTRLTFRYNGRDFRLTETSGTAAQGLIA